MTNILVGKVLEGLKLSEDKMSICFITNEGDIIGRCDAECCSHTWIESINSTLRRLPAFISSYEDIELNSDKDDESGTLQFYGIRLVTDEGEIIIDYRNESNGYYGGWMTFPGDAYGAFYGGVYRQNVSNEKWEDITGLVYAQA